MYVRHSSPFVKIMHIFKLLLNELLLVFEGALRFIPSSTGRLLRRIYYSCRFRKCGTNLIIDIGVEFIGCDYISCGDNVWFGAYTLVEAGNGIVPKERVDNRKPCNIGAKGLVIGNGVSIGRHNIIAAQNEIIIEDFVTLSSNVSLYSISHDYINRKNLFQVVGCNAMASHYMPVALNGAPIYIGRNAWIGLNSAVFGSKIGEQSVVLANNIVHHDISPNIVYKSPQSSKNRFDLFIP